MRPMTDAVPADEDVEEENEDEGTQKNGDDSGSDSNSNDEEQGDGGVADNRAEQGGRDDVVNADVPHADTVQLEEHEKEIRHTGMKVAIDDRVNRVTATITAKVTEPNTISTKAVGRKTACSKAMRPKMRTTKG